MIKLTFIKQLLCATRQQSPHTAAEARSRGPLQRAPAQLCGPRRQWQPHPHRWRLEHGLWSQTRESSAGQVPACRPAGQLQGHWSLLRHGSPPPQDLWQSHVPCGSHLCRTCTNATLGRHKQNHLSTQPRRPRSGSPSPAAFGACTCSLQTKGRTTQDFLSH